MGFLDKLRSITTPFDEDFVDEMDQDESPAAEPTFTAPAREERTPRRSSYDRTAAQPAARSAAQTQTRENKVVSLRSGGAQLAISKPTRYEEASGIADHMRSGKTVVVNLEEADLEVSRRLLDFLSGVAYAQNGEIRRVATKTFVIIPSGVELVGDALDGLQSNSVVY